VRDREGGVEERERGEEGIEKKGREGGDKRWWGRDRGRNTEEREGGIKIGFWNVAGLKNKDGGF